MTPKPTDDAEYCPICGRWIIPEVIVLTGDRLYVHDQVLHTADDWKALLVGIQ